MYDIHGSFKMENNSEKIKGFKSTSWLFIPIEGGFRISRCEFVRKFDEGVIPIAVLKVESTIVDRILTCI